MTWLLLENSYISLVRKRGSLLSLLGFADDFCNGWLLGQNMMTKHSWKIQIDGCCCWIVVRISTGLTESRLIASETQIGSMTILGAGGDLRTSKSRRKINLEVSSDSADAAGNINNNFAWIHHIFIQHKWLTIQFSELIIRSDRSYGSINVCTLVQLTVWTIHTQLTLTQVIVVVLSLYDTTGVTGAHIVLRNESDDSWINSTTKFS